MAAAGMQIGAHTYSHPNLAQIDSGHATAELTLSKDILEDRLGREIDALAYPYGKPGRAYTPETVRIATEAGYRRAVSVLFRGVRMSDSPLEIPRFFIQMDSMEVFGHKVAGWWDIVGSWQEKAPRWAARLISPVDFAPDSEATPATMQS
jgi:peptidoglycan/xylan/chitin deacetylase (PgdA/CDA1 family)